MRPVQPLGRHVVLQARVHGVAEGAGEAAAVPDRRVGRLGSRRHLLVGLLRLRGGGSVGRRGQRGGGRGGEGYGLPSVGGGYSLLQTDRQTGSSERAQACAAPPAGRPPYFHDKAARHDVIPPHASPEVRCAVHNMMSSLLAATC